MDDLTKVLTPPEVAYMWYLHITTVYKALITRRNPLVARKAGHTWLITYSSCEKRWGKPARSLTIS